MTETLTTIAGLIAMLAGLCGLAAAAWGAILESAVRDAIAKRKLSRADKLCRWRQRADALMMGLTVIMSLAGMMVIVPRLI